MVYHSRSFKSVQELLQGANSCHKRFLTEVSVNGDVAVKTTLQVICSKCIPALLYGLEACHMNKSDLRSLDFVVDRLFVKLYKIVNIQIDRECQKKFGFEIPSVILDNNRYIANLLVSSKMCHGLNV